MCVNYKKVSSSKEFEKLSENDRSIIEMNQWPMGTSKKGTRNTPEYSNFQI